MLNQRFAYIFWQDLRKSRQALRVIVWNQDPSTIYLKDIFTRWPLPGAEHQENLGLSLYRPPHTTGHLL